MTRLEGVTTITLSTTGDAAEMRRLCLKESEEVQFTLTIWSLSLVAE